MTHTCKYASAEICKFMSVSGAMEGMSACYEVLTRFCERSKNDPHTEAQQYAFSIRPKVGGIPVLAELLREAGVIGYDVDFLKSQVNHYGAMGESSVEENPAVELQK